MSQANATVPACPSCTSTNGVPMTDGTRLCLDCRAEWNPATAPKPNLAAVTVPTRSPGDPAAPDNVDAVLAAPPAPETAETVLGPPAAVLAEREAQAALEAMVGTVVVLDGGQHATIVDFPDDDHVRVILGIDDNDPDVVVVDFNDVVRSVDAPAPEIEVDDDTAAALARVNFAIAGLVLNAGAAAIVGEYPDAQLVTPPAGWLPLDTEALPALEQGVAYAVAFLIHAYSIDREQVRTIAAMLLNDAQQSEPTKGGNE